MNAKEKISNQVDQLKAQRKKVEEAIQRYEQAIESMKGQKDEASHKKRQSINAALEKLRAQKNEISQEISKLEDGAEQTGDPERLEKEIKQIESQLETQTNAINEKIGSIRERIDQIIDGNDLLEHLVAKERLKLKIRFNREIVKHLTAKSSRSKILTTIEEEDRKLKDWTEKFSILMKEVDSKHGDEPEVKEAKEKASKDIEKEKERIQELSRLHDELKDAKTDQDKEGIQSRIEKLEREQLESEVQSGEKTSEEGKVSKEQMDLEKKIKELEDAKAELEKSESKDKRNKIDMVDTMLDNYRKKLKGLKEKK